MKLKKQCFYPRQFYGVLTHFVLEILKESAVVCVRNIHIVVCSILFCFSFSMFFSQIPMRYFGCRSNFQTY